MQGFVENEKYLLELAKSYPSRSSVLSEIINLNAILNLPKGTEHFMSDIHGEYEAYLHIRRSASGAIRRKVDALFSKSITASERAELATLIYYFATHYVKYGYDRDHERHDEDRILRNVFEYLTELCKVC